MAPVLTEAPPFQGHLAELVFCLPGHKARVSGKGLNLGDFSVPSSPEINGCFSAAARQLWRWAAEIGWCYDFWWGQWPSAGRKGLNNIPEAGFPWEEPIYSLPCFVHWSLTNNSEIDCRSADLENELLNQEEKCSLLSWSTKCYLTVSDLNLVEFLGLILKSQKISVVLCFAFANFPILPWLLRGSCH